MVGRKRAGAALLLCAWGPARGLIRTALGRDQGDQKVADGDTQTEMTSHVKSYSLFAGVMKWGAIVSFVLVFAVILIISS